MTNVLVQGSARAGISNFSGVVSIGATIVECAAFGLEGESIEGNFSFDDRGDNRCGCPNATDACVAVSATLEPPPALPPASPPPT